MTPQKDFVHEICKKFEVHVTRFITCFIRSYFFFHKNTTPSLSTELLLKGFRTRQRAYVYKPLAPLGSVTATTLLLGSDIGSIS